MTIIMDQHANIMIIGRTGVGKSTFINYLVGQQCCDTGIGKPVTKDFKEITFEGLEMPLRIIDTEGLEVCKLIEHKENIINYINERSDSKDIGNWIHTIFYVVNCKRDRVEPEEIKFIKEILEQASQTVNVVVTHCSEPLEKDQEQYVEYLRSQLDSTVNIHRVNSLEKRTRKGTHEVQFGREEVLNSIFEVLWKDLSVKASKNYAKRLHRLYEIWIMALYSGFIRLAEQHLPTTPLGSKNNEIWSEETQEHYDYVTKQLYDNTKKIEKQELKPIIDFYNHYQKVFGMSIKIKYYDKLVLNNPEAYVSTPKKFVFNERKQAIEELQHKKATALNNLPSQEQMESDIYAQMFKMYSPAKK